MSMLHVCIDMLTEVLCVLKQHNLSG